MPEFDLATPHRKAGVRPIVKHGNRPIDIFLAEYYYPLQIGRFFGWFFGGRIAYDGGELKTTMSQAKGNKAKGRQSSRNAKYYEAQFHRTRANKLRRELARNKKFARLAAKRASLIESPQ